MPIRRSVHRFAPLAALLSLAVAPDVARADDKSVCLKATEQGQRLRVEHKLMEAREQFLVRTRELPACGAGDVRDVGRRGGYQHTDRGARRERRGRRRTARRRRDDGRAAARDEGRRHRGPREPGRTALPLQAPDGTSVDSRFVVMQGQKDQRLAVTLGAPTNGSAALYFAAPMESGTATSLQMMPGGLRRTQTF